MIPDLQLLEDYALAKSQDAFTQLVQRHLDLVYTAALRQVRSPQLAEEISQSVFADLARAAEKLEPDTILIAWLYQVTRRTAIDVVRRESRRQARERLAVEMAAMNTATDWTHIEPLLDDAMEALDDTDRAAILLRYFENKSLREVGQSLGTSDDAAQKRVSRAVEQLRKFFSKRGVGIGAGGLMVLISTNAVQSAPVALATSISTAAVLAGGTIHTSTAIVTTKVIAMTIMQKLLVTASVVLLAGAGVYEARQASRLTGETQMLRQKQTAVQAQIQLLENERDEATNRLAELLAENSPLKANPHMAELLELRSEVAQFKDAAAKKENDPIQSAAEDLLAKVEQLKQRLDQSPDKKIPEIQILTPTDWINVSLKAILTNNISTQYALSQLRIAAKDRFAPMMAQALRNYTHASGGELPNDLSQLKPYFDSTVGDEILGRYKLLHTGHLSDVPSEDMLVAEKAVVDERLDSLYSIGLDRSALNSSPVTASEAGPAERSSNTFRVYRDANRGATMPRLGAPARPDV